MKGLVRNNFYMVSGSLLLSIVVSFVAMILGALTNETVVYSIIGGQLGGFGALAATAIQKDATSKWSRFELTLPIRRSEVIKARYLSSILFIAIGFALATLTAVVHGATLNIVRGEMVDFERIGYVFTFGMAFAFSVPTFMIPLVLLFGADKSETLLFVSAGIGLGLFLGSSMLVGYILPQEYNINLIFRVAYLTVSIIMLTISYIVSRQIYKRKEF